MDELISKYQVRKEFEWLCAEKCTTKSFQETVSLKVVVDADGAKTYHDAVKVSDLCVQPPLSLPGLWEQTSKSQFRWLYGLSKQLRVADIESALAIIGHGAIKKLTMPKPRKNLCKKSKKQWYKAKPKPIKKKRKLQSILQDQLPQLFDNSISVM